MNISVLKNKYKLAVKHCNDLGVPTEPILSSPNGLLIRFWLSALAIAHLEGELPKNLIDSIIHEFAINLDLSTEKIESIFNVDIAFQRIIKAMRYQRKQ